MADPRWLSWARRLQAIAQTGLYYTRDRFDAERFEQLREIALEMMACHSDGSLERLRGFLEAEEGYATPKVDVRGAVFKDERVLLVREISDGGWTLPGGWADVNETPSEAVVKEIREESGYHTSVRKLVAVLDRSAQGHTPPSPHSTYKLLFWCDLVGGEAAHSSETDGVGFFAETDLPELSLSRTTKAQIELVFRHYRQPELPADFD